MGPIETFFLIAVAAGIPIACAFGLMGYTIVIATAEWRERRRIRRSLKRLAQAVRMPRPIR